MTTAGASEEEPLSFYTLGVSMEKPGGHGLLPCLGLPSPGSATGSGALCWAKDWSSRPLAGAPAPQSSTSSSNCGCTPGYLHNVVVYSCVYSLTLVSTKLINYAPQLTSHSQQLPLLPRIPSTKFPSFRLGCVTATFSL